RHVGRNRRDDAVLHHLDAGGHHEAGVEDLEVVERAVAVGVLEDDDAAAAVREAGRAGRRVGDGGAGGVVRVRVVTAVDGPDAAALVERVVHQVGQAHGAVDAGGQFRSHDLGAQAFGNLGAVDG